MWLFPHVFPRCHLFIYLFYPQLGTCVAQDANPAANITWLRNNKPLAAHGKGVCSNRLTTPLFGELLTFINMTSCIYSYWGCHCKLFSLMNCAAHCVQCLAFGHYTVPVFTPSYLFTIYLGISIQTSVLPDPVTGLSTTTSTLEYSAEKEDVDAQFACSTQPTVGAELVSSPMTFTITCESQTSTNSVHLKTLSASESIVELLPRVIGAQNKRRECRLMVASAVRWSPQAMKT